MKPSSEISDVSSKKERAMTDAYIAQEMIQEAFPLRAGRNIKAAIGEAFEALKRRERSLPKEARNGRPRQWTERRVRSIWHREARRIDHYEIEDLTAVAIEEARVELRRSKERAARLEAMLAGEMASGHRALAHRQGQPVGRMDRAGDQGAGR